MTRSRTPLTRERVLSAAMAVADTDGVPALTMRRLAADLGVEAMSLYHHVRGKEALLDGLVEAVVAEIEAAVARADEAQGEEAAADADWRDALRRRFLTARTVVVRHPWTPGLVSSRASVPPSVYAYFEQVLATMVEGGVGYDLAHRALHSFGSMALGFTQELFSPVTAGGSTDVDLSEAELTAMADALPHLSAMVASELHAADGDVLGWCDSQAEFEFTLDLLLDGLEAQRLRTVP
ncbi:TetR/AcrR family transcriptional regulator [uncultured Serinicoccus sp.]|uniref:TetR/AcrR family transcriptional regulator n=1 Tax=uncultured Serinicoccus sp. TaxID=735514 RepID=UPI002638E840|nr:TetR/AcrR family transcriptional regulator C-terminal domain-containing protein [uncultured Serinicoccus sp.]